MPNAFLSAAMMPAMAAVAAAQAQQRPDPLAPAAARKPDEGAKADDANGLLMLLASAEAQTA